MNKFFWIFKQLGKELWLRTTMFCVLSVLIAFLAYFFKSFVPEGISQKVGADSVDNLLQIIANSMLIVTTFSLSTMVAAYSAASNNVTPRSISLLIQDSTTQNALSVFIGAFMYSLVSIIALSMQIYGDNGRLILFAVTIGVVAVIIAVLLRWISYLSKLGRVGDTIDVVEKASLDAIESRIEQPYLGGVEQKKKINTKNMFAVCCEDIGYVENIDMAGLSKLAKEHKATFYLAKIPGHFISEVDAVLYSNVKLDDEAVNCICGLYAISGERSFEQDPRFGLIVLSEIASRGLSPAMNDHGTAIDILASSYRVLLPWISHDSKKQPAPRYENIHVPAISTADILDDVFLGIARDGAANVQVGIKLQKTLAMLSMSADSKTKKEIKRVSQYALEYAEQALSIERDVKIIKSLAM